MNRLLDVSGLHAGFHTPGGWSEVLHDVSFAVAEQEIVGIVGESGSGKSTLVRSILDLLPAGGAVTAGRATFAGQDLIACGSRRLREVRGRHIGFVAQNPFSALNPVITLARQFKHLFRAHGRSFREPDRQRVIALLEATGIRDAEHVLGGYAFELSGGMAQRVVIAMATILEPSLIIADEPTTALDLTVQRQVLDVLVKVTMSAGRSAIIVTHDLGVVANYCDRVIVMLRGGVVEHGEVVEVLTDPQHPYTRHLLDSGQVGLERSPASPRARTGAVISDVAS